MLQPFTLPMFCKHLMAYPQQVASGVSTGRQWKLDAGTYSAHSLKNKDYARLPLFTRKCATCRLR